MITQLPLFLEVKNRPKITILEGPDSCGKTYNVKQALEHAKNIGLDLRYVRCPDNRIGAPIRETLFSDTLREHPMAQAFLFMADFLLAYEMEIKPHLDNPDVFFIFDRFLPSTCVYQGLSLDYVNRVFCEQYPEFTAAFAGAQYIYLNPGDLNKHTWRMSQKASEEINHLDPKTQQEVFAQIRKYRTFAGHHKHNGLLGSRNASIVDV